MSSIFPESGPISLGAIVDFVNTNTNNNISKNNISLRSMFELMRNESFQAGKEGYDFFAPDKFSEMHGMIGYENLPPQITLVGKSSKVFIKGQY